MSDQKPLPEQITASNEDVKALLDDNRKLSIAFLSRRLRDMEAEMRERFRAMAAKQADSSLEETVKKLKEKLNVAAVKYREMREDLDKLRDEIRRLPT